ncbi:MAG: carbamoyltransferase [Haliscomenobacteraceae bacterium CHB4]|nr:Decarbamoylnovobiocin carbamoyltransferase [Saprospiraceae bacterium]MCE7923526.1 carbamoyltransferase [Haliscomenobacteraceae bacterium CHB4]
MYILSLNAYHGDASAAIFKNGELLAATEEERIRRVKHWAGLPVEAAKFCLQEAGISLAEVDYLAVSRDPKAKILEKAVYALRSWTAFGALQNRASNSLKITKIIQDLARAIGDNNDYASGRVAAAYPSVKFIEHHRSHLASAFFASPFEEAALLSIDGFGDFTSTMRAVGRGNRMEVMDSVSYPHSLGVFYTAFTQFLGFPHYGDEYKVMGLAPYGQPSLLDQVRDVVYLKNNGLFQLDAKYFRHFREGVSMSWEEGAPHIEPLFSNEFIRKFGPARQKDEPLTDYHRDLAASVQRVCEEVIFHIANDLQRRTGLKNLCVAGGVAQNSVANGKLVQNTGFERIFIPPAGHDAGTAVGAGMYLYHQMLDNPRRPFRHHAYTGAIFSDEEIEAYLERRQVVFERLTDAQIYDLVTDCLLNAGVVGWFQGRAEFGPRALGNRSILADPRRADAKDLLNAKIKRRESFRPFAPSILMEHVADYFEQNDSVPFMEKVFLIKPDKRTLIPAVTHIDGTGRLQTVEQGDNPRYYALIRRFYEKTGVPVLLNTSFNENEPIVNAPEHALECYLRTKMDMLVMGNIVIKR